MPDESEGFWIRPASLMSYLQFRCFFWAQRGIAARAGDHTFSLYGIHFPMTISIRVPCVGDDGCRVGMERVGYLNFNPRPRVGDDSTAHPLIVTVKKDFNPRPPRRGRQQQQTTINHNRSNLLCSSSKSSNSNPHNLPISSHSRNLREPKPGANPPAHPRSLHIRTSRIQRN